VSEGVGQLAFLCAVLGGFAVTFPALLLTLDRPARHVGAAIVVTTASAAAFLVSTVGCALMAFALAAQPIEQRGLTPILAFGRLHEVLTAAFLLGGFLFLATLGLSGWIRSRRAGTASTIIATVAAIICAAVVRQFIVK
jgi:hypothetical protein